MVNVRRYRTRVTFTFNTDRDVLDRMQNHAKGKGMSSSEYLNSLIQEDLRNEEKVNPPNPCGIRYSYLNLTMSKKAAQTALTIPLDHFIEVPKEADTLTKAIQHDYLHVCYANVRIMFRKMSAVTRGRVPDV